MATWQQYMKERIKGREPGMPWYLHDKLKCYKFCEDNGILTAEVLREFNGPDEIDLSDLEGEFVLKPTLQSSTRGVMVLEALGDGYFEALRRRFLTTDEIVAEQAALFAKTNTSGNKIIVERKIKDLEGHAIPRDYKAYAFAGEAALILEINRNTSPVSVAWFDGDFRPVTDGRVTSNPAFTHEVKGIVPQNAQELVDTARRTSSRIGTPFASIDMYSTTRGVIVGEITLAPGGLYHGQHYSLSEAQQELMGLMWEDAVERLKDSASRSA